MKLFKKTTITPRKYLVLRNGYNGLQVEYRSPRIIKHTGSF